MVPVRGLTPYFIHTVQNFISRAVPWNFTGNIKNKSLWCVNSSGRARPFSNEGRGLLTGEEVMFSVPQDSTLGSLLGCGRLLCALGLPHSWNTRLNQLKPRGQMSIIETYGAILWKMAWFHSAEQHWGLESLAARASVHLWSRGPCCVPWPWCNVAGFLHAACKNTAYS